MIRKKLTDKSSNLHQQSPLWRNCSNIKILKQIHASMVINGFNSNPSALRELIYASAISIPSTINYAHQLFDQITQPDLFTWNTMIRGSAQSPTPVKAVALYNQMEKCQIRPDKCTFPFVLKACTKLSWVKTGCAIHGKVVKFGFEWNSFGRNALIYFHANCGDIRVASELFDGMAKNDVVAWSALTAGYARRGELVVARKLFDEMPVRDVVTWNVMIAGYVLSGEHERAMEMFEEMRRVGERPDEVTMLSLLSACADSGALEFGEKIHCSLLEMHSGGLTVLLGNVLIDMYAKCGSIQKALEVFQGMREKDLSSWNSVIGGLAFHGHSEEAICLFEELKRLKIRPNEITFVGVLVACSHAGEVKLGHRYFNLMRDEYNIEPNIKHCGCMVDMLGRAGKLTEAFEFIDTMQIQPNAIVWRTLLGACRVHGNIELGRRANEQLLKMRNAQSGDYVLLSNIYASQGAWDGVETVRKSMDDSGVRKEVGCSLIEADNKALMHFLLDSKFESNSRESHG